MKTRIVLVSIALLGWLAAPVHADWDPGDPYKMHFPQLPDPFGLDVNMTAPRVLADDWLCTATGPVSDIHFWFSVERDDPQVLAALLAAGSVHASVHADIPVGPTNPYSQPGALLWERDFFPGEFTFRPYGTGEQGWFDPAMGNVRRPDHFQFYQMNITNIFDPFIQTMDTIYWLDLSITLPPGLTNRIGWKTTLNPFQDDAVWAIDRGAPWEELIDPTTGQSLDLAFVVVPEPASLGLLLLGGVMLLRRRA